MIKKRIAADYTALAEKIETNSKSAEFKVDDKVRITKCQTFFGIGIDLLRQENTDISQQINFTGQLGEDDGASMLLSLKSKNTLFDTFL